MADGHDIDVDELLRRVRDDVKRRQSALASATADNPAAPLDNGHVVADLASLHSLSDPRKTAFTSHRPLAGRLIVAVKTILQKLLTPILERQAAYNAASLRVSVHTREWIGRVDRRHAEALQQQAEALRQHADALQQQTQALARQREALQAVTERLDARVRDHVAAVESRVEAVAGRAGALEAASARGHERLTATERRLRRILHLLQDGDAGAQEPRPARRDAVAPAGWEPEFDYAGFEDRFRGDEADIRERQKAYLPYFEGREHVVDLGCGRGEFLELLRERGVKARGVDLDLDMTLSCRDKMLDVVQEDVFAYLQGQPDASLGGIFSAQLVEHLPALRVIELVKLCYRKLAPGAVLILETPNPQCLMVFADSFYRDLSHIQPIHPETLQFVLQAAGFERTELRFSAPVPAAMRIPPLQVPGDNVERFNEAIERLNGLLFGFQDYAAIGRKV